MEAPFQLGNGDRGYAKTCGSIGPQPLNDFCSRLIEEMRKKADVSNTCVMSLYCLLLASSS